MIVCPIRVKMTVFVSMGSILFPVIVFMDLSAMIAVQVKLPFYKMFEVILNKD